MYLQIPDWKFPFKNSHHPVCAYATRKPLVMRLRYCDPDVISGTDLFHFMGADDCKCKVKIHYIFIYVCDSLTKIQVEYECGGDQVRAKSNEKLLYTLTECIQRCGLFCWKKY